MGFLDDLKKNLIGVKEKISTIDVPKLSDNPRNLTSSISDNPMAFGPNQPPVVFTIAKNLPKKEPSELSKISGTQIIKDVASLPAQAGRLLLTRPIRMVAQSFQDIGGYAGDKEYTPEAYVPKTPVEKALFGDEPIESFMGFKNRIDKETAELGAGTTGIKKNLIGTLGFMAQFAPLGDILPGGEGKEKVIEKIFKGPIDEILETMVKSTDDVTSFNILKNHVSEEIAKEAAPAITAATTKEAAETAVRDAVAKQLQVTQNDTVARIAELSGKQKVAPLTADELDELKFLQQNKDKPEAIILANKVAESKDVPVSTVKPVADEAYQATIKNGGVTISLDGNRPSKGIAYSPYKDAEFSIAKDQFNPKIVDDYIVKNESRLMEEGNHLGMWEDDGKIYLDISKVDDDPVRALENATNAEQLAAFDLSTFEQIPLGKIDDGMYNRLYEKATDNPYINKGKNKGGDIGGAPKQPREVSKERQYITSARASEDIASDVSREISDKYNPKSNKELVEKSVQRVSDDFEEAKKFANENSTDEAVATRVAIDKELSSRYVNATTEAEKKALATELKDSIIGHARLATEEGRTVQANALLGKQTPEGMLRTTSKMIDKYNKGVSPAKQVPQITEEAVQKVLDKSNEIAKMPEGLPKQVKTKELVDELESLIPSPMWKKVVNVWKAGLLTGIKTSGVNIQSSFWNGVAEQVKNVPAVGIDLATSLFTGTRTKALNLRGLFQGGREGMKKGWNYMKTGIADESAETALEFNKVNFDSKPGKLLGNYADTVYRVLGAEDMPFFYGALRRSLGEQALVTIKNEGKVFANSDEKVKFIQNFIDNPPEEALTLADLDAKIATFKNDTALGHMAQTIQNAPVLGPAAQMTILPFAKTPSAVATQMLNYTPAGPVIDIAKMIVDKKFDQRTFADSLGRAVTGTAALWLGSELYNKGMITLGYPKDEKEKAKWEATGKTPNSIKIGDAWVPLVQFGPQGAVMGIGGYFQSGKEETGSNAGGVVTGLAGGLKSLTEQTFLTGVKNLIDVIDEPEKKAELWAGRTLGSVIPTIVADVAQAFDDYQRKSSSLLDPLQARIPDVIGENKSSPQEGFTREGLRAKLDVWGQPIERNRSALATALSPIRLSNTRQSVLNTEVERLEQLGEDIRPTKVESKIKNIKLDDNEYYKYQRVYGDILTKGLTILVKNKEYQALEPEEQTKIWKQATKEIKDAVNVEILPQLIKRRYQLPEDMDPEIVTQVVNELYKKNEKFAGASVEKQKAYLFRVLGKSQ